ncbi:MAG: ParB/RepB/Spo0J family partition protein [Paludibacteraceae bacterium]|nr:ParB/RepB/Spo0J family partition protein [Paludibacteraceae bacterium]
MAPVKKPGGLGRGLDALIDTQKATFGGSSIDEIALEKIVPNPNQPRQNFDETALQELADSIRENGVISPITLRKGENDTYTIIAGERRFRASKLAGLQTIPAYIREAKDEQMMEWALIENIQREDLDAIEIALSYQKLMDEYNLTQERMSEKVGKKRATISNYIRLLQLPAEIQMGIRDHKISMGHARALLAFTSIEKQLEVYRRVLADGLSVRDIENLSQNEPAEDSEGKPTKKVSSKTPTAYVQQQEHLTELLGTKVQIKNDKIVITFKDEVELASLMSRIH